MVFFCNDNTTHLRPTFYTPPRGRPPPQPPPLSVISSPEGKARNNFCCKIPTQKCPAGHAEPFPHPRPLPTRSLNPPPVSYQPLLTQPTQIALPSLTRHYQPPPSPSSESTTLPFLHDRVGAPNLQNELSELSAFVPRKQTAEQNQLRHPSGHKNPPNSPNHSSHAYDITFPHQSPSQEVLPFYKPNFLRTHLVSIHCQEKLSLQHAAPNTSPASGTTSVPVPAPPMLTPLQPPPSTSLSLPILHAMLSILSVQTPTPTPQQCTFYVSPPLQQHCTQHAPSTSNPPSSPNHSSHANDITFPRQPPSQEVLPFYKPNFLRTHLVSIHCQEELSQQHAAPNPSPAPDTTSVPVPAPPMMTPLQPPPSTSLLSVPILHAMLSILSVQTPTPTPQQRTTFYVSPPPQQHCTSHPPSTPNPPR
jgi:hypothetical protein